MRFLRKFLLILFLFLFAASLWGQTIPGDDLPAPYEDAEFPDWAWKARRFEIITLGSFPFVYMFTTIFYDLYIYASHGFDDNYAFGSARDQHDLLNMFTIAISVSGAIAVLDMIIQSVKDNRRARAQENTYSPPAGE